MKSSVKETASSPVAYQDLRQWLQGVTDLGELKTIRNVHWDREIGAMVEMCYRRRGSKTAALLFDDVPGYPAGYRCLYGMMCSPRRFAFTVGGIDVSSVDSTMEYLKRYRRRMKDVEYIPPVETTASLLFENVLEGGAVDVC